MARLNVNDYSYGYDQGHADGYAEGYDTAMQECEGRIAKLVAEMRTMEARVAVAIRKVDERG